MMDIMEYLFDQDNVTRLYGIEQWKIGFEKGLKEAKEELFKKHVEEGRKEAKITIANNLLAMNMDIPFIEKATGLSKAEILKLKGH